MYKVKHLSGVQATQSLLRTEVTFTSIILIVITIIAIIVITIIATIIPITIIIKTMAQQVIEEENSSEGGRDGEAMVGMI